MIQVRFGIAFSFTVGLPFLTSCGDGGEGSLTELGRGGNGGERTILDDPWFGENIAEIFNRRGCSSRSRHGSAQSAGLDLRSGSAYGELVNVEATQAAVPRVIPGDTAGSYLVVKLEGRQTVGSHMPLGGSALDNIDLTNIKNWINRGAKNNGWHRS